MDNDSSFLTSIIIPVFNTEKYLNRCISTLVSQSEKNIELIFVDDLSTDNSKGIILSAQKQYSNIRYIQLEEKKFAGGARNVGISEAKGQYIGFVDSDDWVDTNMLKKMTSSLQKTGADIAICGVKTEFDSPFEQSSRYCYEFENVISGKLALDIMSREFFMDISISPIVCNKIYKRQFLHSNAISFIENNYNEDDVFNYMAFLRAQNVVIVPDTFYHYYQRQDSITHTFSKKHIDDLLLAFNYLKEYLIKNKQYKERQRAFHAFFEKCLHFILSILINTEKDIRVQNEYLQYLFKAGRDTTFLSDYWEFVGLSRIRKFLNPIKE